MPGPDLIPQDQYLRVRGGGAAFMPAGRSEGAGAPAFWITIRTVCARPEPALREVLRTEDDLAEDFR